MKMYGFRVEVVYPNEDIAYNKNFTDYKLAYNYYNEMITTCSNDGYDYDYITIYCICGDVDDINELDIIDHYYSIDSHSFKKEQPMIKFNNISSEYDGDIDETFYQWCISNNHPYYSDDEEYPEEFQSYYITNVYSHTSQGVIAY